MQPSAYEPQPTPSVASIEALRRGRHSMAARESAHEMTYAFAKNRLVNPDVAITNLAHDGMARDNPVLHVEDLVALEAVGIDMPTLSHQLQDKQIQTDGELQAIQSGPEGLSIRKLGQHGISVKYHTTEQPVRSYEPARPVVLSAAIADRFARSPGHRELARINRELATSSEIPVQVETKPFDPREDPLGSLVFLKDIGLLSSTKSQAQQLLAGESFMSVFASAALNVSTSGVERSDTPAAIQYTWGRGVARQLTIDRATGSLSFVARQTPEANYAEVANQSNAESIPFIETQCAEELSALLDKAGLMFHPELQKAMMSVGESDRYGSIYTRVTREIAKWVNRPDRTRLSTLFVSADPEYMGDRLVADGTMEMGAYSDKYQRDDPDELEAMVRRQWQSTSHELDSESAQTVAAMVDGVLDRSTSDVLPSDLPLTNEEISMKTGGCFDVLGYYFGAAPSTGVRHIQVGDVSMLEKTHGEHTFLSLNPMVFNGVHLPRGALFTRRLNGWAFMRLTAFAFDNPNDQTAAAGSELSKAWHNQRQTIQQLGGTTLSHVARTIR